MAGAKTAFCFFWIFCCVLCSSLPVFAAADNPSRWQWPPNRNYHVVNYKLTLRFNQPRGEVLGDEVVTLRPLLANFRKFYLDSSELTIESVALLRGTQGLLHLRYTVDGSRLWVTLDHIYDANHSLNIRLVYHGFPRTGLYFINPTPDYPNAFQEIYSQGEPESNHYWFPCWDYPNDMATSETITTVPEGQTVVSNGKLVSVKHSAGQVTYDWVERVPHSSYLISLAIGPWNKVSDTYDGKPVDYYVPKSIDEDTARRTFHLTPDMLRFFSTVTGVEWPYEQYAQTTVHDFLFGGQENVSATTLTDWTLHGKKADRDYPSTNLVSHELGQQWCGDYVQGRDWANIWLNEGCATFLDALYTQYHAGNDEYRFEIYNYQIGEQAEERTNPQRSIVDRHYTDPMQMLDEITHEKGAAALDMLRFVLDGASTALHPPSSQEPLLRALHYYLTTNRTHSIDTHQLLDAVRAVTGQEVGWFFREWVYMTGYPDYRVTADYNPDEKVETIVVVQTQHIDSKTPAFDMPIDLAFYGSDGQQQQVQIHDDKREQEFRISLGFRPVWVDFDPYDFIDKTLHFEQPVAAMTEAAQHDPSMMARLWAVQQLGTVKHPLSDEVIDTLARVLSQDQFYGVQVAAATNLAETGSSRAKSILLSELQEPDDRVRAAVVTGLGRYATDPNILAVLLDTFRHDHSYAVNAAAAEQIGKSKNPRAVDILAAAATQKPDVHVMLAILDGVAATNDTRAADFLIAESQPGIPKRIRLRALTELAGMKPTEQLEHSEKLAAVTAAALRDPFFLIQGAGENVAGAFRLIQFRSEIEKVASDAPTIMQRDAAARILYQFGTKDSDQ